MIFSNYLFSSDRNMIFMWLSSISIMNTLNLVNNSLIDSMENPLCHLKFTTANFIMCTLNTDKIPSSRKRGADKVLVGT